MGIFSVNKASKTYLSFNDKKKNKEHVIEVKGGIKLFLYIDGEECDFVDRSLLHKRELRYSGDDMEVLVKIEGNIISLFIDDVQVTHVKM